ncbi:TrmB family transcriptional regulator [Archaeoglobus veneficus]|uniref:Transcriptional regulator, TrmB n=1 Tax=Archaeoglobus veneficus (strain DSM 11195 / SNP6) TaxID=693661 RepID=F2KPV9_ARCVS|nr:TrmB family transcriptional regulator [Archaeoglobus veneficus]AEA46466.1 transcriptional regulator, TrmB [Archaeoglobus veneficus SNP6]
MIENLRKLGLSEYEAKVYVTLVGLGKASAREIHEASGVPRTRIYDVLEKLASKGFVDIEEGEPKRFRAVDPRKVIEKLKMDVVKAADDCILELEKLKLTKRREFSPVWVMRGDWNILEKIRDAIMEAREEIVIVSAKPELLLSVAKELKRARKRTVCVLVRRDEKLIKELSRFVEFREFVEIDRFIESYVKGLVEDGVRVRIEGIFVFDGRKSIVVIEEDCRRLGLLIALPIVAFMQRSVIETIITEKTKKLN